MVLFAVNITVFMKTEVRITVKMLVKTTRPNTYSIKPDSEVNTFTSTTLLLV